MQKEANLPPLLLDVGEVQRLRSDIISGRWDQVLKATKYHILPATLEFELLSLAICDLIELGGDIYPAMQLFKRLKSKLGFEMFNEIADLEKVCSLAADNYGKA